MEKNVGEEARGSAARWKGKRMRENKERKKRKEEKKEE